MAEEVDEIENEDELPVEGEDTHEEEDEQNEPEASGESDTDDDPERQAIRERRRQERLDKKRLRQEREQKYQRELAARDRVIGELSERLSLVEKKSTGAELAQLDAAINQTDEVYRQLQNIMKTAVEAQDGQLVVETQEKLYQMRQRKETLDRVKKAQTQNNTNPQTPLNPRVTNQAQAWMERNKWYDPTGQEEDSDVVMNVIDRRMTQEGWDPAMPEYWQELDSRIKKYLPHRVNSGYNSRQGSSKPVVTGSGKDSATSSTGTYKLSAERVSALKDAGMWDDPKQREAAIKRFREFDKQHATN